MYSLINSPVLLPHQITILKLFFASPITSSFFLTGGTALAAFYFGHRESKDLDLFTLEDYPATEIERLMNVIAKHTHATISTKVKTPTYHEMYLTHTEDGWTQRIDLVKDQPRHFGDIAQIDGVAVDSLENIGSNKILTLFSRLEPKDYIDFYFIVNKTKLTFDQLFQLAKQKDLGLTEFYFANSLAQVDQMTTLPTMKVHFDRDHFIKFYQDLSRNLFQRIKPKE